eukprot:TRINITY_DN1420_c0_g4_i1.p1 TRINITY_DN1420_c0_g4~~TRINITY_DN1420_c0_g4_i1.p1  ORF type:complete len:245 (-),score=96.08 TRINITY_DN1420_c0_g4_i1:138-872(-)
MSVPSNSYSVENETNNEVEEVASPSLNDRQLSYVNANLETIPPTLAITYGSQIIILDLSHNLIEFVSNLEGFVNLQTLNLDSNKLTSNQNFASLRNLTTLSVNDNQIDDLVTFIGCVSVAFPKINFLSMLKNRACPNFFFEKETNDYQKYRYYVLSKIPKLRYLDSTPVSEAERKEAARVGHLMVVARPKEDQYQRQAKVEDNIKPLPQDVKEGGVSGATFGRTRYIYVGKESQGNRFITDSQL